MATKYLQTKSTSLTYGISDVSTTIQLKNLLKLDGTSISASDIGDLLYGTFAPGTSREEIFSIVGANVTVETNGNISITSVVRGLKEVSPYTTGGYSCDHPAGEVVVFGNNPQVYQWLKDYIDNIAIQGSPDATTGTKGVSKMSVAPVSSTNPIAVGDNDPRLPTTDQSAAFVGSQGVPSATNKFVTQDNVYSADADQSQTTQDSSIEVGMVNSTGQKNKINQSFTPVKTKTRGVKLYKIADTGTFTGTVTVALYADSAGSPTGSALSTKTITNAQWLAIPVGEFEVNFTAEYSMTAGTLYWIQISTSTADNSNHPNLGDNTGGGYANGSVKYWNGTDGYVTIANIDLYFKILQGVASQILQTDSSGSILPTIIMGTSLQLPLGESFTGATTPQPATILNDLAQTRIYDVANYFGYNGSMGISKHGVRITPRSNVSINSIKLMLARVSSPVDNLVVTIETDSSNLPSGTVITNGTSNAVTGSTLGTVVALTTFSFPTPFTLTAGTSYWIVVSRSGALDVANYYKIGGHCYSGSAGFTPSYGSFIFAYYNGSWSSTRNGTYYADQILFYFEAIPTTGGSLSLWQSDSNADMAEIRNYQGMVITTGSAGALGTIVTGGTLNKFNGLQTGVDYYVSTTKGEYTTTPTGCFIGTAISQNILKIPYNKIGCWFYMLGAGGTATALKSFYNGTLIAQLTNQGSAAYYYIDIKIADNEAMNLNEKTYRVGMYGSSNRNTSSFPIRKGQFFSVVTDGSAGEITFIPSFN